MTAPQIRICQWSESQLKKKFDARDNKNLVDRFAKAHERAAYTPRWKAAQAEMASLRGQQRPVFDLHRLGKNIIAHRHENLSWRKAFLEALVGPVPKQTSRIPRRWSITNKELESESDKAQNACCACTESNYAWSMTLGHQKQGNWKPIRHSPKLRHHKASTTLCDSSWISYMWMTAGLVYNKFKFLQIQYPKKTASNELTKFFTSQLPGLGAWS